MINVVSPSLSALFTGNYDDDFEDCELSSEEEDRDSEEGEESEEEDCDSDASTPEVITLVLFMVSQVYYPIFTLWTKEACTVSLHVLQGKMAKHRKETMAEWHKAEHDQGEDVSDGSQMTLSIADCRVINCLPFNAFCL